MREDQSGIQRSPRYVTEFLRRIGGTNPYSEPNFRIALAQNRVTQAAGLWHDWREEATLQERGGIGSEEHPLRVVAEIRTIPRYPICECEDGVIVPGPGWSKDFPKQKLVAVTAGDCRICGGVRGWIIERWTPAHLLFDGPESQWYEGKVPGTTLPVLGPYPAMGEYVRVPSSRATSEIPSLTQLGELVFYLQDHAANQQRPSPEQAARERAYFCEVEKERHRKVVNQRNREMMRQSLDPLLGSSLRAGAEREKYAQRLRQRGVAVGHTGN